MADWCGEEQQGGQGEAGRADWTHGAAAADADAEAEAVRADDAGGSALRRRTLARHGPPHLPDSSGLVFFSNFGVPCA